jgi:TRAP transporter TAXI family solute receptor
VKNKIIYCFGGILIILIASCVTTQPGLTDKPQQQSIIIGTGGSAGMYYPTGKAICRIINIGKQGHGIHCTAKTTKGSADNLMAFALGDLRFGIAKSDRIYQAFRGLDRWIGKPQKKLRTIFSTHSESVHLMADSSLYTIQDLKGKNVDIGPPGWMDNIDALATLNAFQIDLKDINESGLKRNEAIELFQKGQLDAIFYTVGDPSGIVKKTSEIRNANIIPLGGREIDELIVRSPFYHKVVIPVHWYPKLKNKRNIPSFGYKTIFFTSAEASEEVVYRITREVFNNFEKFKKQHPAFEELTKQNMVEILDRLAPIHPGALRYFKKVGLK